MNVAAVILAAGLSSRMGSFKPLLPWGKQTVIESCINYLRDGGVDSIVVVAGHREEDIRRRLASASVTFAVNADPASAMSASIEAGVRQLPSDADATFITPADYPAISPAIVSAITTEWTHGFRLIKPTYRDRGGHPVLIDLSLRSELLSLEPTRSLKDLFAAHQDEVRRLAVNSPYIARDIDTWDDYRALYAEVFGTVPVEAGDFSNENHASLI
jgi:CTP:molybdopterin cytidylyltransferase MocA